MSKLSYIIGVLILVFAYMVYKQYFNVETSIVSKLEKRYDYIIVGAGTAGSVLAARLSEDPNTSVLLVEAGELIGYLVGVPMAPTVVQQGPHDWSFYTKPQRFSSFGLWNQSQCLPRGKGLGGSGQINYLLHGFGLMKDYEEWKTLGVRGWSFEDLKPYFRRAFGTVQNEYDSRDSCKQQCAERKAPMKLRIIDQDHSLLTVFKHASAHAGEKAEFRRATATLDNGVRLSSFDAYLKPIFGRKNLHVLIKTHALSIRFQQGKAASIYILKNHRHLDNIFVNKEIILSAGAIKTPQLLMLSGIGPKEQLKRQRIKEVKHVAGVGKNFHDHMNMPIYVSIKKPISVTFAKLLTLKTVWDYYWKGSGYLAFPPVAGTEFLNDTSALILFTLGSANENILRDLSNYKPMVFRQTFKFHNYTGKEGFIFLATCLRPKSRGVVTLTSDEALKPPLVDPNYLANEYDVTCMIRAMRRAIRLVSTRPFRDIGAVIHWARPERCAALRSAPATDRYLECLLREVAVTGHHAGGTCAMGGDRAVVDHRLRVRGVSGVRVVDASVLPSPVSLYPNSVLIAMAEKAAEMIKRDK